MLRYLFIILFLSTFIIGIMFSLSSKKFKNKVDEVSEDGMPTDLIYTLSETKELYNDAYLIISIVLLVITLLVEIYEIFNNNKTVLKYLYDFDDFPFGGISLHVVNIVFLVALCVISITIITKTMPLESQDVKQDDESNNPETPEGSSEEILETKEYENYKLMSFILCGFTGVYALLFYLLINNSEIQYNILGFKDCETFKRNLIDFFKDGKEDAEHIVDTKSFILDKLYISGDIDQYKSRWFGSNESGIKLDKYALDDIKEQRYIRDKGLDCNNVLDTDSTWINYFKRNITNFNKRFINESMINIGKKYPSDEYGYKPKVGESYPILIDN